MICKVEREWYVFDVDKPLPPWERLVHRCQALCVPQSFLGLARCSTQGDLVWQ